MICRISSAEIELFETAVRRFIAGANGAVAFAQSPGTIAFVAVEDHDVQGWCWGYLLARPDATTMLYLHNLEVAERYRRQGIGRGLLRSFIEAGTQLGASRMFLVTGAENRAARSLYESMGAGLAAQGPTVNYWFLLSPAPDAARTGRPLPVQCQGLRATPHQHDT